MPAEQTLTRPANSRARDHDATIFLSLTWRTEGLPLSHIYFGHVFFLGGLTGFTSESVRPRIFSSQPEDSTKKCLQNLTSGLGVVYGFFDVCNFTHSNKQVSTEKLFRNLII